MQMFERATDLERPWDQQSGHLARNGHLGSKRPAEQAGDANTHARHGNGGGLDSSVQATIVPRLVLARRGTERDAPCPTIAADEIADFTRLIIEGDELGAAVFVDRIQARGVATDAVYLGLLAPAAALLGEAWTDDTCSFTDVTIGLQHLQRMVRDLGPRFNAEVTPRRAERRALLAQAPGGQHGLGLQIVGAFLNRAGWQVELSFTSTRESILDQVRSERFALVGLSVASDRQVESLATLIRQIRREALNPAIGVMVGGPVFVQHPDLASKIGADATAADGRHAAQQAEHVLELMLGRA